MKGSRINLLPKAARFQLAQLRLARKLKRTAYLLVIIWLFLVGLTFGIKLFLTKRRDGLLAQKSQLQASIKEFNPQIDLQQALRFRLKVAAEVLTKRLSLTEEVSHLKEILPPEAKIKSLKIKGNNLELTGEVSGLVSLAQFEEELIKGAKKYYSQIKVGSFSQSEGGWNFSLELEEIKGEKK